MPRNLSAWVDLTIHLIVMLALALVTFCYSTFVGAAALLLWAVLAAGALAFSLTLVGLWGFSMSAGAPGSGYGFNDFLSVRPWRSLVLGMGACAWIVAVVGAVVREVDLLADDSRSA